MSLFEIKCPMCKGTLWLDMSSGKVVDHKGADQKKADFNDFLKNQQNRTSAWDDKMQKAREEEARRKAEREEAFKKAREQGDTGKGEYHNPLDWD